MAEKIIYTLYFILYTLYYILYILGKIPFNIGLHLLNMEERTSIRTGPANLRNLAEMPYVSRLLFLNPFVEEFGSLHLVSFFLKNKELSLRFFR